MSKKNPHVVEVPVDLSEIDEQDRTHRLKVVGRAEDGSVVSTTVSAAELAERPVRLAFEARPGSVRVAVGPAEAEDEHLLEGDTLHRVVTARSWEQTDTVVVAPIRVTRWYWRWWLRWCRTISVHGRLVCPDGSPVPGAVVTAYDVDWWFLWLSKQQAGVATTADDGTFTMTFTWCCGRYPWWWWLRERAWRLDPALEGLVRPHLADVRRPVNPPTVQPSLSVFEKLIEGEYDEGFSSVGGRALADLDPASLAATREKLLATLPAAPELAAYRIWPWAPWEPWFDCRSDLIFSATQDCGDGAVTVLDESVLDTRWNVPDTLSVTLVAEDQACCIPEQPEEECLIVDRVCDEPMHHVAGNVGAPAAPAAVEGYQITQTDGVDQALDIPFGGSIPIYQNPSDLVGVDYYGFEHSTDGGLSWDPLPIAATEAFSRSWYQNLSTGKESFAPALAGAFGVYETRRHFQDTHYGDWYTGPTPRVWLSHNHNLLLSLDSTTLADGTHHLKVVQFTKDSHGNFSGPEPVLSCDGETQAGFVLEVDNRVIVPTGHDPAHNCGEGVHVCTPEPDTHITSVTVDGVPVGPCDTAAIGDGDVVIEFEVTDPDGHLRDFRLSSHYGNNGFVDLTQEADLTPGGSLLCLSGGPDARTYGQALAGGAVRPHWYGGTYRLTLPASVAFPVPCCYLLRLTAYKRTRLHCHQNVRNRSEMTLGVGV